MGRSSGMSAAQAIARRTSVWRPFVCSRLLVVMVALVAVAVFGVDSGNAGNFDEPSLTHPLGAVFATLPRWDSTWYLGIAHSGYSGPGRAAFFPLYPLVVRSLVAVSSPAALLVASYVVSLACLFAALWVMERLVSLELGPEVARRSVLLLCFFPGALWLGVPYSESLFLLLSVAAFWF